MLKMLIVDDEKLLRNGIIHMADWEKHDVTIIGEASNGKEAIELLEKIKPDIVITDIRMPVMDGIELTRLIKENYKDVEVIILSSYSDFEFVRKTLTLGAIDYILKHKMNFDDLLNIIRKIKPKSHMLSADNNQSLEIYDEIDALLERQELDVIGNIVKNHIRQNDDYQISDKRRIYIDLIYHCIFRLDWLGILDKSMRNKKMEYIKVIQNSENVDELEGLFNQFVEDIRSHIIKKQYSNLLEGIMIYIQEKYEYDISLSKVSREFHISKEHLCNRFKKETGINYNDFVTDLRIKEAKKLLRQTNHSVNEVAGKVGYNSTSYFSNIFKKRVNMTPSQYASLYSKRDRMS